MARVAGGIATAVATDLEDGKQKTISNDVPFNTFSTCHSRLLTLRNEVPINPLSVHRRRAEARLSTFGHTQEPAAEPEQELAKQPIPVPNHAERGVAINSAGCADGSRTRGKAVRDPESGAAPSRRGQLKTTEPSTTRGDRP